MYAYSDAHWPCNSGCHFDGSRYEGAKVATRGLGYRCARDVRQGYLKLVHQPLFT